MLGPAHCGRRAWCARRRISVISFLVLCAAGPAAATRALAQALTASSGAAKAPLASAARRTLLQLSTPAATTAVDAASGPALVAALVSTDTQHVRIRSSIVLSEADWAGQPFPLLLSRNFTLAGQQDDIALWPILDINYLRSKVMCRCTMWWAAGTVDKACRNTLGSCAHRNTTVSPLLRRSNWRLALY
jgi:hypothetical protein